MLHGPPGVGKTCVGKKLLERLGEATDSLVILDLPPGEVSCAGCYPELEGRSERVLVIELMSGEQFPPDPTKRQPTRNPREWLQLVRAQGREFYAFLLWAEWDAVAERRRPRGPAHLEERRVWYDRFRKRSEEVCFPEWAGISEERINTMGLGPEEIADFILCRIGEATRR